MPEAAAKEIKAAKGPVTQMSENAWWCVISLLLPSWEWHAPGKVWPSCADVTDKKAGNAMPHTGKQKLPCYACSAVISGLCGLTIALKGSGRQLKRRQRLRLCIC